MFDFGIESVGAFGPIAFYEGGIFLVEFRDYSTYLLINDADANDSYLLEQLL